jgi:hypothetical protein
MSICETPIDFFSYGKRDVLSEVRTQQARGEWTKARRARWTKQAVSYHMQLKYTYPEQREAMSYYAGRIAALKSKRTADFSKTRTKNMTVYRPLDPNKKICCDFLDCGSDASWECYPQEGVPCVLALCDCCKQERVRMEIAYTIPDDWDWDEDEIELPPLPVLGGGKLVVREPLEVRSIFLPCTTVVGLGLLDMTLHVPILLFVMQAVLFLHFIVWGKGILQKFCELFESEL